LLDDRDLAAYADQAVGLPPIARAEAAKRLGYVQIPAP